MFVHASAAVIGEAGVLVRGASGAGKTSLVLRLVADARRDGLFARLVADDRVALAAFGDRLVARPHPLGAGLVERRGFGIVPIEHEPACVVRLVVDLVTPDADVAARPERWPDAPRTIVAGVVLPALRLPAGGSAADGTDAILWRLSLRETLS